MSQEVIRLFIRGVWRKKKKEKEKAKEQHPFSGLSQPKPHPSDAHLAIGAFFCD
jgi:hypothetical protein